MLEIRRCLLAVFMRSRFSIHQIEAVSVAFSFFSVLVSLFSDGYNGTMGDGIGIFRLKGVRQNGFERFQRGSSRRPAG